MAGLDPDGTGKTFGLRDVHDLLDKLRWEITDLREHPKWAAQITQFKAFNCAVTVWHIVDWIFEGITPRNHDVVAVALGVTKVTKPALDDFVFARSREVALCRQVATGAKHRRVARHNDENVTADLSAQPVMMISRFDGSSYPDAPYYEAKIIDAQDRRIALDVFERAQLFLGKLVREWQIDPRPENRALGD